MRFFVVEIYKSLPLHLLPYTSICFIHRALFLIPYRKNIEATVHYIYVRDIITYNYVNAIFYLIVLDTWWITKYMDHYFLKIIIDLL